MTGPFSYGPGIQAFLVNLLVIHMVEALAGFPDDEDPTGQTIAEATL